MSKALADAPDQVRVESEAAESETRLRLVVAEEDLGKLIGKGGRTARSLRTILNAAASRTQQRFTLDVDSDAAGE